MNVLDAALNNPYLIRVNGHYLQGVRIGTDRWATFSPFTALMSQCGLFGGEIIYESPPPSKVVLLPEDFLRDEIGYITRTRNEMNEIECVNEYEKNFTDGENVAFIHFLIRFRDFLREMS